MAGNNKSSAKKLFYFTLFVLLLITALSLYRTISSNFSKTSGNGASSFSTPTPQETFASSTNTPTSAPKMTGPVICTPIPIPDNGSFLDITSLTDYRDMYTSLTAYTIALMSGDASVLKAYVSESEMPSDYLLASRKEQVECISPTKMLVTQGSDYAEYVAYCFYDIKYKNSLPTISGFLEICFSCKDLDFIMFPNVLNDDMSNFLVTLRTSQSLSRELIMTATAKFIGASYCGNRELLSECVTDTGFITDEYLEAMKTNVENYRIVSSTVFVPDEDLPDCKYVLLVETEILFKATSLYAPGLSEYILTVGSDGFPLINSGKPSSATDAYLFRITESDFAKNKIADVNSRLQTVLSSDETLKKLYDSSVK